jgi:CheY-like chemotaxis protein
VEAEQPVAHANYCPVCVHEIQEGSTRCGTCNSILVASSGLEFALNRNPDWEKIRNAVEQWEPLADGHNFDAELGLAIAYLNLLDYKNAVRHYLKARELDFRHPFFAGNQNLEAMLHQPVVLVVDDSHTIREVIVRLLGSNGFLPLPVANAWEVVPTIESQSPAAVILDVTMPMMDGYEVCRMIRGNREIKATPVLMLSGHGDLLDKVVGKLAGATEYLGKPFKPDHLIQVVRKYAKRSA